MVDELLQVAGEALETAIEVSLHIMHITSDCDAVMDENVWLVNSGCLGSGMVDGLEVVSGVHSKLVGVQVLHF